MKIACVGNMNNMLFGLVRFLRDRGIDAHLLLQHDEFPHFHPSCDSYDLKYREFVHNPEWGGIREVGYAGFHKLSGARIREELAGYEFLIVSGNLLAFVERAGRTADIFCPHGSDLFFFPFHDEKMRWDQRLRQRGYVEFYRNLRSGIRKAKSVNQEDRNPFYRAALQKLGVLSKTQYIGIPMVYSPIYGPDAIVQQYRRSAWYEEFRSVRDVSDLMVIYHGRQQWLPRPLAPGKGSDNLIRAFGFLAKRHPGLRARLVLLEYGEDVHLARQLVRQLAIETHVSWFPQMARKEIMIGLSVADFGCGEFNEGCIGGGTTWEVLVAGKPLLHFMRPSEVNFSAFTGPYPVVNVRTPGEIAAALESYLANPEPFRRLGQSGRDWYEQNFAGRSVNAFVSSIKAADTTPGPLLPSPERMNSVY